MVNLFYLGIGIFIVSSGLFVYHKVYFEFDLGEEYHRIDGEGVARWIGSNVIIMGIFISFITALRIFVKDYMSLFLVFGIVIIIYVFAMRIKLGLRRFKGGNQDVRPRYVVAKSSRDR